MTKEEARDFKDRWRLVNEFIADEIRNTPPETRLLQLRTMFASAHSIRRTSEATAEEDEIRNRWQLLKQRTDVRS